MQGSKQAIRRLKATVEEEFNFNDDLSKESLIFLIQESIDILDRIDKLDIKDEKSHQIDLLSAAVPAFVLGCIESNKEKILVSFLRNLSYLREVITYTYSYLTENAIRSELELSQLANDIEELKKQKNELEGNIQDLEQIISLKKYLDQSSIDVAQLNRDINDKSDEFLNISDAIKQTKNTIDESHNEIKELNKNINELNDESIKLSTEIKNEYTSVEKSKEQELAFIDTLEGLHKQSRTIMGEINEVLGDANRTSMASSFKMKEDELSKKVAKYDFLNYATLTAIATTAFLITVNPSFFNIPALSLQSFYERVLIFIPLGIISWFASRKSHQLFQLKEEYAYKYASAVAFEGYKRQTETNEVMKEELLKIAIENLGKNPTAIFDKKLSHTPVEKIIDGVTDGVNRTLKNN